MRDLSNNEHLDETVRGTLNRNLDKFISYGEGIWGNVRVMTPEELADYLKCKKDWKKLHSELEEKNKEYKEFEKQMIEQFGEWRFRNLIQDNKK